MSHKISQLPYATCLSGFCEACPSGGFLQPGLRVSPGKQKPQRRHGRPLSCGMEVNLTWTGTSEEGLSLVESKSCLLVTPPRVFGLSRVTPQAVSVVADGSHLSRRSKIGASARHSVGIGSWNFSQLMQTCRMATPTAHHYIVSYTKPT